MYSNSDTPSVSFSRSGFFYQFRSRVHSNHAAIVIFLSFVFAVPLLYSGSFI